MDADAQQEHYKKERKRAENIAKFIALHRIKTDENLKEIIKSQIKLTALGLISQAKDMQAPFSDIEVIIKENEGEITAPVRPRLCEEQPFKTNLGLIELAAAEV